MKGLVNKEMPINYQCSARQGIPSTTSGTRWKHAGLLEPMDASTPFAGKLAYPGYSVNERAETKSNPFDSQYSLLPANLSQVLQHISYATLGKTLCLSALTFSLVKWLKL